MGAKVLPSIREVHCCEVVCCCCCCCCRAASGQPPQTTAALPPAALPPVAPRRRSQRGRPTLATSAAGSPHTTHVCSVVSIPVVSMYFTVKITMCLLFLMVLNFLPSCKINFFLWCNKLKAVFGTHSFFFVIEWLPCSPPRVT